MQKKVSESCMKFKDENMNGGIGIECGQIHTDGIYANGTSGEGSHVDQN